MKKLFTLSALLLIVLTGHAQNIWDGSESTNFMDTANWNMDEGLVSYASCHIGSATNACVYDANGKFFQITMLDGGHLTVSNLLYADKLFTYSDGANSNIIVENGGTVNIRNGASAVAAGTITILDGGHFECKSNINFIWGRWNSDNCTFNLFGGTTDFSRFAPWRNGYINDAYIVFKGGGVGTHASGSLKTWAENGRVIPAQGSLLTYTPTEPNRMSSIDFALNDTYYEHAPGGVFTLPSYFDVYATGDLNYDTTLVVTQTPAVGTVYGGGETFDVEVSVTDYFGNNITKTFSINTYEVPVGMDTKEVAEIGLFPNPSNGSFNLSGVTNPLNITVYNTVGKQVYQDRFAPAKNVFVNSGLNKGVYLVRIESEGIKLTKKLVVE